LIRIAFIDKQRSWTGQTKRTLLVISAIDRTSFRPIAICQPGSILKRNLQDLQIPIFEIRMDGIQQVPAILRVKRILQANQIDIVDTHGYRDHVISICAARLARTKAVLRTKHNTVPLKSGVFSRFIYNTLTTRVIAISEHIRQALIASGMRPENISTIHSAIDAEKFSPREKSAAILREFGLTRQTEIVGMVARIHQSKGIDYLLNAIALVAESGADRKFLIIGKGREKLTDRLKALKIEGHVIAPGFREDIPDILSIVDVFVMPTLREGLGTAILEAMAMGKPIVATRVGGIPEAVQHGVNGLLVPPADAPALATAIQALLTAKEKRLAMGRQSRRIAEQSFSRTGMISAMETLFRQVLEAGTSNT
jgi:glycosyltransferase involved in cell wall biosynthesis